LRANLSGQTPELSAFIKAPQSDLSDLLKLGGFQFLLSGKGDFDLDLTAYGFTPHQLASNSLGTINIVMANGTLDTTRIGSALSNIADSFVPGLGILTAPSVNCLAAHLLLEKGQLKTNGVIFDMKPATFILMGGANLEEEKVAFRLLTKEKSGLLENVIPPIKIMGSLASPEISVETHGALKKAASSFIKNTGIGSIFGFSPAPKRAKLPEFIVENGQNACVYTLDRHFKNGTSLADDLSDITPYLLDGLSTLGN
jgi:hypothetical protein